MIPSIAVIVPLFTSLWLKHNVPFSALWNVVRVLVVGRRREQLNNCFYVHYSRVSSDTRRGHCSFPHASSTFTSCFHYDLLFISTLVQLVNLFALDQRKFPRGCVSFSSSAIGKSDVFTRVSEIVCLYERELVFLLMGWGIFFRYH